MMKYEIDLFGVLVPSLLVWVVAAYFILLVLRGLFRRAGVYRHVWHRALFDFSIYLCLLGGIVYLVHRSL